MVKDIVLLREMQVASWVILLVMAIASIFFLSLGFTLSLVVGGIVSLLSFSFSCRDVAGFLESLSDLDRKDETCESENKEKVRKTKKGFILRFWCRIAVIGIVLFVLIKSGKANVFGLLLGLSTMVITVMYTAISVARRSLFSRRR